MKKCFETILCLVVCICSMLTVSHAASDEYSLSPRYNNTVYETTAFVIDDSGKATVSVSYVGYSGITSGATIKIKLQKKFLLFFWQDVDIGTDNNTWVHEVTGDSYSASHTLNLSKGTYRVQVDYEIRGTGGGSDIITKEIERTY
ncbi:MAG: hypothetical protein J6C09_03360 [Clostridia bacterium]|nr:hypothetical protein [Clostridia bacterium]